MTGREGTRAAAARAHARDDCRQATLLYAIGDRRNGDRFVEAALAMLRAARQFDAASSEVA